MLPPFVSTTNASVYDPPLQWQDLIGDPAEVLRTDFGEASGLMKESPRIFNSEDRAGFPGASQFFKEIKRQYFLCLSLSLKNILKMELSSRMKILWESVCNILRCIFRVGECTHLQVALFRSNGIQNSAQFRFRLSERIVKSNFGGGIREDWKNDVELKSYWSISCCETQLVFLRPNSIKNSVELKFFNYSKGIVE